MFVRLALVLFGLGFALQVSAQETASDPAAPTEDGLSMGETVVEGRTVGERYIKETFGDWAHRCLTTESGDDPCEAYQLLLDSEGNAIAEVSLVPIAGGGQAAAGATVTTPLETLLTRQLTISVDGGVEKRYPFAFCTRVGCFSRIGLTQEDVDTYKAGAVALVTVVPAQSPETIVELPISLTGFTAAFDGLSGS
ncbi:MAG: invasion associated locus B family protein [Pseudomonadota bacterium]